MYDPVPSDMTLAALVVSLVLALAGFVWVRRIATVEGDSGSFRATAPKVRDHLTPIAVVVLVALLSAVAVLIFAAPAGAEPMFDPEVNFFGLPARVVTFWAGLVGCAIGVLWIRRIAMSDEMDPKEWGALAPPSVSPLHFVAGLAVTALLGTTIALALG
jgi:hypothetical protein